MKKEIFITKKLLRENIHKLHSLSQKDLEMLTILRLFDNRTFLHSIETLLTAKRKIERPLDKGIIFKDLLEKEGVTMEQFQRACLFHDIGKIAIPKFLLNSHYTDENWAQAFIQLSKKKAASLLKKYAIEIPEDLLDDSELLMEHMIRNRVRGAKFVPIKTLFSKKHTLEIFSKGFSPEMSLIDIMQKHERESEEILDFMGYPVEAQIVGRHHNYKIANDNAKNNVCSCPAKRKDLASDLIHLADIQEALKSNRPYLAQRPVLKTLAFMIDDAERGLVNCIVTYLWVKDELEKIDPEYLNLVMHHSTEQSDHEHLRDRKMEIEIISSFLAKAEKFLKYIT